MARYRVKPGYCLHLVNQVVINAGEEAELSGDQEQDILANQGWKIEPVAAEPDKGKAKEAGPEVKEVPEPPQDRAVTEAKTK